MPAPNSIRTGPPRQREDHPPRTRKGLPTVKQVLQQAKEVDFDDKSSRVTFLRDFKDHVGGDKKAENEVVDGEVFHELARDSANFRQYEHFIKWAFARNSKLLECRTKHDDTPLLLAIEHHNHEFVRLVLDKVHRLPRLVGKLLQQSDQVGLNCLHKAIMSASPFTESIIAIMRKASTSSSKDGENTANDSDSGTESEAEMTTSKLAKIKDDIFTAKSRKSDRTEGWTALHFAVEIFAADQQLTDNEEEFREAMLSEDSSMRGASAASARQYEDKPFRDYVQEVQLINDDEVLSYIREYVIDNFDRRTAMMAVYKVGCERTIEFDLSGLPYKSINKDFFTRLGNVLHFEGRLKYVALPRLTVENDADDASGIVEVNHQRQTGSMGSVKLVQRTKDLQHMCTIFDWLKSLHVKFVLKVTVMDDAELSHSDEAIETCMKGLDVRVWNWRRVDLCIDVISSSAPNVTDVTLYSSGNNAVLVGWSSKGGLPKLKEGLDAQERFKQYRNTFESKLKKHKPNVKVSWGIDIPTQDLPLFARSSSEKASREPKWMKTMKQFATFLRSVKPKTSIAPIKIAIIDDGIDSTLDVFSHRIQTGESFYKAGSGRWQGAYYVPTGYHGTLMAQLICDICPVARLYIAQLEPVPRNDGRRGFTQQSAIEAINWAVNRGVDIISMSWSIVLRSNQGSLM
ncbi:hypothetical protein N0V85_007957 [Neurospora sp. IMI 360204]|nr:hypothetical protein N0V85_007957 [Neurospora sp. IMI 360204]